MDTTRVDFYEMAGRFRDPLEVACILVGKAFPATRDIVVIGRAAMLEELDSTLWDYQEGRFLAHSIDNDRAPIRLKSKPPPEAQLLINLDAEAELPSGTFARVLEIVPPDEASRPHLRRRWTEWKARGADLHHHILK